MDHLLFLSQRRHEPFAAHIALPDDALTPTGASLPSVVMPLFTSSYSSSTSQTSLESPCLSSNLHSLRCSKPDIRSLKASPLPLTCLLALRGVYPWRLPAAQAPQPFPWHPALGWLLLPPSLLSCSPQLLGTSTNPRPIPEPPRCGAHPQRGRVVLIPSWMELAMSSVGTQVFSAWHPLLFASGRCSHASPGKDLVAALSVLTASCKFVQICDHLLTALPVDSVVSGSHSKSSACHLHLSLSSSFSLDSESSPFPEGQQFCFSLPPSSLFELHNHLEVPFWSF